MTKSFLPNNLLSDLKRFVPLLVLYIFIILIKHNQGFDGDEGRYITFAKSILQGEYSPAGLTKLPSGPGYPLFLAAMLSVKMPWLFIRLMNAVFLFGGIVFFYRTLAIYTKKRIIVLFSYLLGLYPMFFKEIHMLITETLAIFLTCAFIFFFVNAMRSKSKRDFVCAGLFFGYLALTKIFFGYVILSGIVAAGIGFAITRSESFRKSLGIGLFALLVCTPYLSYTYQLTGKLFYWGTYGGPTFYWMSTPYEGEFGDWKGNTNWHLTNFEREHKTSALKENHGEFFSQIDTLDPVIWDEKLKARAIENIKSNPQKFLMNWVANVGRLLFNYPFSYTEQRISTLGNIFPNMFIVVLGILLLYPTIVRFQKFPFEILALLFLALVAFGGSSLLSAYERQFRLLVPLFLLWQFYTLMKVLKIEIRKL